MKRKPESRHVLFGARAEFKRTASEKLKVVVSSAAVIRVQGELDRLLRASGVDPSDIDALTGAVEGLGDARIAHASRGLHLLAIAGDLTDKRVLAAFYAGIECASLAIESQVRGPLEEKARRDRSRPRKPRVLTIALYQQELEGLRPRELRSQKSRAAQLAVHRETLRRFEREHADEVAAIVTKIAKNGAIR